MRGKTKKVFISSLRDQNNIGENQSGPKTKTADPLNSKRSIKAARPDSSWRTWGCHEMAWNRKVDAPFCVPGTNTLGAHWKLAWALASSEALEPSGLQHDHSDRLCGATGERNAQNRTKAAKGKCAPVVLIRIAEAKGVVLSCERALRVRSDLDDDDEDDDDGSRQTSPSTVLTRRAHHNVSKRPYIKPRRTPNVYNRIEKNSGGGGIEPQHHPLPSPPLPPSSRPAPSHLRVSQCPHGIWHETATC